MATEVFRAESSIFNKIPNLENPPTMQDQVRAEVDRLNYVRRCEGSVDQIGRLEPYH